jgi:Arc/MetJ family transcription regulator
MAANLAIDDELLNNAVKAGGLKTKKDTVNLALKEFIQRRKTADIIDLFGKISYGPEHDHKNARRSGR